MSNEVYFGESLDDSSIQSRLAKEQEDLRIFQELEQNFSESPLSNIDINQLLENTAAFINLNKEIIEQNDKIVEIEDEYIPPPPPSTLYTNSEENSIYTSIGSIGIDNQEIEMNNSKSEKKEHSDIWNEFELSLEDCEKSIIQDKFNYSSRYSLKRR